MNIKLYLNKIKSNSKKKPNYISEFKILNKLNSLNIVKTWEEANIIIEDIIYIKKENIIYDQNCYNNMKKNNFENKTILYYDHKKKFNENFVPFYTEFIFNNNDSYENLIKKIDNYLEINKNENRNKIDITFIFKRKYGSNGNGTFLIKYDNNFYKNIINYHNNDNFNNNKMYNYLIKKIQIREDEIKNSYVVQKYIENPYLKDGKKSDLGVHFIIVKYGGKIQLFLHNNIIFKSTILDYDINNLDIKIHLTNTSLQNENKKLLDNEIEDVNNIKQIKNNVKNNVNDFCNSSKFKKLLKKLKKNNKCFNFCYMTRFDLVLTDDIKTYIIEINDYAIGLESFYQEDIKKLNINPVPFAIEISDIILNNREITEDIIKKHNFTQILINKNKIGGNNNYYDKYIKYKTKYLRLCNN